MKVFKSSTHSYLFLTKIWISQSVFHQFAWSLAVFWRGNRRYQRPVFFRSFIFKYERPRLQSGLFSGPVWSFSSPETRLSNTTELSLSTPTYHFTPASMSNVSASVSVRSWSSSPSNISSTSRPSSNWSKYCMTAASWVASSHSTGLWHWASVMRSLCRWPLETQILQD